MGPPGWGFGGRTVEFHATRPTEGSYIVSRRRGFGRRAARRRLPGRVREVKEYGTAPRSGSTARSRPTVPYPGADQRRLTRPPRRPPVPVPPATRPAALSWLETERPG